ncbi:MAG TPA: VWA domain-containing protein [Acidobacteriaceae bacterium]|jgi:VWFA-related protein
MRACIRRIPSPRRFVPTPAAALPILGLLLAVAPFSAGQTTPPDTTLHSTSTLVVVPTLVRTPAKDPVYSLAEGDFALTDDGVLQKIAVEADQANGTRPLSLVVLMQIGGAAQARGNYAHLDTMLASIVGKAPNKVAIVQFDSRPEYDSPFTSDLSEWSDAINQPEHGDGGAAIFDGLAYALKLLKDQPRDTRHAILLISQQHDEGSKTNAKEIVRDLGENNTAVYSLTFSVEKATLQGAWHDLTHHDKPYSIDQPGVDLLAPIELALGAMQKNMAAETASLSGGEPFAFSNKHQFDMALNTLANHVKNGYTLTFQPTSSQAGLHTLKVSIPDHPEFLIDARVNYWSSNSDK